MFLNRSTEAKVVHMHYAASLGYKPVKAHVSLRKLAGARHGESRRHLHDSSVWLLTPPLLPAVSDCSNMFLVKDDAHSCIHPCVMDRFLCIRIQRDARKTWCACSCH